MSKITKLTIIILAVVAVVTQGIGIFISNTSATDSIHAAALSSKLEEIQEDNINLESEILSYASYQVVASRAAALGFEPSKDFISVYEPVQVASIR